MESLEPLARELQDAQSILIATHQAPDGDGIGCQMALRLALTRQKHRVVVVTSGEIPPRFRFLPGASETPDWDLLDGSERQALLAGLDFGLIVDTHAWDMMGTLAPDLLPLRSQTRFLDHHPNTGPPIDALYGDPTASSTGEICWHLIRALGATMTPEIATCLYTAITYDTNSFKYLRQRPETLRIAADLLEQGAEADEIYRHVFASKPLAKVRITGELTRKVDLEEDGMIAWTMIDSDLVARTHAMPDDLRDVITELLEIQGVEIAVTFKQRGERRYKVSMRSKGRFPINGIATELGGGGHAFAAGVNMEGDPVVVQTHVLDLVRALIRTPASA